MTTLELFLKLVRNALWLSEEELPEELSANMAANILRGAKEQGLLGVVIDALIRNKVKMPEEQHLEAMVLMMKVKQGNEEVNEGLRRLKELFDSRGINYVVVKGQAVGAYYPKPMLRQAGDIDYYCNVRNFSKAQETVRKEWGVDDSHDIDDHHVHFDYKGVIYEGHFSLISFYCKKLNRYWQQLVDEDLNDNENLDEGRKTKDEKTVKYSVKVDGMEIKTLSPTMHAIYVFVHLYSHLLKQGISMRQFCDLAVLLHYCQKEIDHNHLQEILKRLGLERAFRTIGSILIENLGMPAKDLGYELTNRDRRYVRCIFDIVKNRGNMGHYNLWHYDIGWKHSLELAVIKVVHFFKLWPLAPAYSCRWIAYEMTKKIKR